MRTIQTAFRVLLTAVVVTFSLWATDARAEVIKVGLADDEDKRPDYNVLIDHLERSSGHKFELEMYPTVEDLYLDFKLQKIRLAFLGPVLYAHAHDDFGVIPLVKDSPNTSVIIVRNDSGLRQIDELRGKRIAFGYPESTTSNLIPRMMLRQGKIGPADLTDDATLLKSQAHKIYFEYAGSHQAVIEAVLAGTVDAGAVLNVYYDRNEDRGLVALSTSEPYPGVPLVCRPDEDPAFIAEMRKLFSSYKPPADSPYHHFKNGVSVASNADYDAVRYLCNVILNTNY